MATSSSSEVDGTIRRVGLPLSPGAIGGGSVQYEKKSHEQKEGGNSPKLLQQWCIYDWKLSITPTVAAADNCATCLLTTRCWIQATVSAFLRSFRKLGSNEKSWRINSKKSFHLTEPERLAAVAGPGHAQPPVPVGGRPRHRQWVLLDGPQAPVGVGAVEAVVRRAGLLGHRAKVGGEEGGRYAGDVLAEADAVHAEDALGQQEELQAGVQFNRHFRAFRSLSLQVSIFGCRRK